MGRFFIASMKNFAGVQYRAVLYGFRTVVRIRIVRMTVRTKTQFFFLSENFF